MNAAAQPRLVLIHGTSGPKKHWLDLLNESLKGHVDPWDDAGVLAVDYRPFLKRQPRSPASSGMTRLTVSSPESKATFDDNRVQLSRILSERGTTRNALGQGFPEPVVRKAAKYARDRGKFRKTAERYRDRRESVCSYVLNVLDEAGPGDLIVIGYSLGSVVAADLLPRLGPDHRVRLLLTMGSPLSAGSWDRTFKDLEPFPYDRLRAWVNIHNRLDWVTGRRGLQRRIPQVIDVRIGRFPWPDDRAPLDLAKWLRRLAKSPQAQKKALGDIAKSQHRLDGYVRHAVLADAIEWAVGTPA